MPWCLHFCNQKQVPSERFSIHSNLEQLLIKTLEKNYSNELMMFTELYSSDLNKSYLKTQLEIFSSINIQPSGRFLNNDDIHQYFKSLPDSQMRYLNQVVLVVKFILLMPITNAVSERSTSAVCRIKTYFLKKWAFGLCIQ